MQEFRAKKQTGDELRLLCGLARNGRTQRLKKTNQIQIFIRIFFFFQQEISLARDNLSEAGILIGFGCQGCGYLEGLFYLVISRYTEPLKTGMVVYCSSCPFAVWHLFPIIIFALRIKLNRMLIVCWWDQLAFYSTLQMSGNEGDFSGRRLCVQLAESNPNKCVPLMERFLSNTASSLNILSVHLHRTDIYAPMSVTLYMKYLFYIFSGWEYLQFPFSLHTQSVMLNYC